VSVLVTSRSGSHGLLRRRRRCRWWWLRRRRLRMHYRITPYQVPFLTYPLPRSISNYPLQYEVHELVFLSTRATSGNTVNIESVPKNVFRRRGRREKEGGICPLTFSSLSANASMGGAPRFSGNFCARASLLHDRDPNRCHYNFAAWSRRRTPTGRSHFPTSPTFLTRVLYISLVRCVRI
jgi:hypothetical protein